MGAVTEVENMCVGAGAGRKAVFIHALVENEDVYICLVVVIEKEHVGAVAESGCAHW